MSVYEDELKSLDPQRPKIARFFRVALHCHTPLSHDWAQGCGDAALNAKQTFLPEGGEITFLKEAANRSACDVIVVTDHMKCGYAVRLVEAAKGVPSPVVIPGMEVNFRTSPALANVKIHLLAILSQASAGGRFGSLLGDSPEEGTRAGTEEIERDLKAWVADVHRMGGICIAAHVESNDRGIRSCFRQTADSVICLIAQTAEEQNAEQKEIDTHLREFLFDVDFDAIELRQSGDSVHYRWITSGGDNRRIPGVLGLDAHCLEDYHDPTRITLMKMTKPTVQGMKEALVFADTRLRFPADLLDPPSPRLLAVSIVGDKGQTFFPDLRLAFSENLNCIIGPRGCGKSTLVEAVRYVFGYNETLNELDRELAERVRKLQKDNLQGALIRVYYRTSDGDTRVLEASYDEDESYASRVFLLDGEDAQVSNIEAAGSFPLRLYGWSEIEMLGRESGRQRQLFDRMIPNIRALTADRQRLRAALRANREAATTVIHSLQEILERDGGQLTRFMEYKANFEKLNDPNVSALFAGLDLAKAKIEVLEKIAQNAAAFDAELRETAKLKLRDGVNAVLQQHDAALVQWWTDELPRTLDVAASEREIAGHLDAISHLLARLQEDVAQKTQPLTKEVSSLEAELREALSADAGQQNVADLRENARKRLAKATGLRDEYCEQWRKLRALLAERIRIAGTLRQAQARVSEVRRRSNEAIADRLNHFMDGGLKIAVDIRPEGDREDLRKYVKSRLLPAIGLRAYAKWYEVLAANYTPPELSRCLLLLKKAPPSYMSVTLDNKTLELKANDVTTLLINRKWMEKHDGADVNHLPDDGKKLLTIMEIDEVEWDDHLTIALNGRPVQNCSPGQRSSAMLPLIALAETSPLMIDQPEDNLDNRMVGHVLVRILAELKEQRQIIVCTHNPNIVVSGDAEQVVALDAVSGREGQLGVHGSIDNSDVVETVIDIMEGGKQAFTARRARYNL